MAESHFCHAQAALLCARTARYHARTLSGAARQECFAYARAEVRHARMSAERAGAHLGLIPRHLPLTEVLHIRGYAFGALGTLRESRMVDTIWNCRSGQVLFRGTATKAWAWLREHEGHTHAPCPCCSPEGGGRPCLNCAGSGVVEL